MEPAVQAFIEEVVNGLKEQNRLLREKIQALQEQTEVFRENTQLLRENTQAWYAVGSQLQALQADRYSEWVSFLAFKCDDRTKFIIRHFLSLQILR
jgi:FtsZ-binding cell division protein ZapB